MTQPQVVVTGVVEPVAQLELLPREVGLELLAMMRMKVYS